MGKSEVKKLLNFSIININKPSGPTSFSVSDFVRKKLVEAGFEISKTSHFGTLDPKVTGVLPVAVGRACKLTGFFLGHDKEYVGVMHMHEEVEMREVQKVIDKKFVGKIKQLPPIKSRVKREERVREVKKFELIEQDGKDIVFVAEVEGGTYIRKLIHDLGEEVCGAHMTELRRIRAGIFKEDKSVKLYDFEKAVDNGKLKEILVPAEHAIKKIMLVVELKNKKRLGDLLTGKPLLKGDVDLSKVKEDVFAVFCDDKFVEICKKAKEGKIIGRAMFVYN